MDANTVFEPSGADENKGMMLFAADFIDTKMKSRQSGVDSYKDGLQMKLSGGIVASAPSFTAQDFELKIAEHEADLQLLADHRDGLKANPRFVITSGGLIKLVSEDGFYLCLFTDLEGDLLDRHENNPYVQNMLRRSVEMDKIYREKLVSSNSVNNAV